MAAGLGFKDFVTGEVLTAADVDGYLMQGVWVFASAAARDAAVTSPQEGNFAYLKDTNVTTYYTGSAWANLDTTGMTNPMTTTGDTIYSSSGSTPARLAIGSTGNVLTVAGGVPTWAAPAGGGSGLTLIDEVSFTASAGVNINDVFSSTYNNYRIIMVGTQANIGTVSIRFRLSGSDTTTNYQYVRIYANGTTIYSDQDVIGNDEFFSGTFDTTNSSLYCYDFSSPNLATQTSINGGGGAFNYNDVNLNFGTQTSSTQFTGFSLICAENMTGKISVYGYAKE